MADPYDEEELGKLSLKELDDLIIAAQQARSSVQNDLAKKMRKEWAAQAAELGVSLDDIIGTIPEAGKVKLPPKYRNPNNRSQTWAGRGMKPAWVKEHLDSGGSLDDLKVQGTQ